MARIMDKEKKDLSETTKHEAPEDEISETGWAWMVLIGGFLGRGLTDGLAGSLAVFIVEWKDYFDGSLTELTWITSLIAGLQCILGPLGSILLKRFSIRQVVMTGAILTSSAFIAASFATKLWHLYLTSTIAGIGFGLIYSPSFVALTYYFDKRLARVIGVTSSGSAMGMFILPPLFQILISYYQWQGAILILAALVGNICVCGALYRPTPLEIKARKLNVEETSTKEDKVNENTKIGNFIQSILKTGELSIFKQIYFNLTLVTFALSGIAYIVPYFYLASRAVNIGFSKPNAALLVSSIGIGSVVARLTHGIIIDHHILSASVLTSFSYILSSICNILIPLTDNYSVLLTYAVFIGISSGVYLSTQPVIAKDCVGLDHISGAIGWLFFMNGVGLMLGSFLTGVLVDATGSYDFPFYLAGICFMFCSLFVSAKPITESLQKCWRHYMDRTFIQRSQDPDTALEGVVNGGVEINDINFLEKSKPDLLNHLSPKNINAISDRRTHGLYSDNQSPVICGSNPGIPSQLTHGSNPNTQFDLEHNGTIYRTWLVSYV